MKKITFVTGNNNKLTTARIVLEQFGYEPLQDRHDIVEIQSENIEAVARHKASEAYKLVQAPVVITDDAWDIPALRGFPGPYMHSVNAYFTPEDFLRLTKPLADRRIFVHQQLVYQDANIQQYFVVSIEGVLLDHSGGESGGEPAATVISMDGRHSIAQVRDTGTSAIAGKHTAWHELGEWLKTYKQNKE